MVTELCGLWWTWPKQYIKLASVCRRIWRETRHKDHFCRSFIVNTRRIMRRSPEGKDVGTDGILRWQTVAWMHGVLSHVQLFATPWTVASRLLCPLDFPGKNTRMAHHFLLQGSSQHRDWTHVSCSLLQCRQILYHWAIREAQNNSTSVYPWEGIKRCWFRRVCEELADQFLAETKTNWYLEHVWRAMVWIRAFSINKPHPSHFIVKLIWSLKSPHTPPLWAHPLPLHCCISSCVTVDRRNRLQ